MPDPTSADPQETVAAWDRMVYKAVTDLLDERYPTSVYGTLGNLRQLLIELDALRAERDRLRAEHEDHIGLLNRQSGIIEEQRQGVERLGSDLDQATDIAATAVRGLAEANTEIAQLRARLVQTEAVVEAARKVNALDRITKMDLTRAGLPQALAALPEAPPVAARSRYEPLCQCGLGVPHRLSQHPPVAAGEKP